MLLKVTPCHIISPAPWPLDISVWVSILAARYPRCLATEVPKPMGRLLTVPGARTIFFRGGSLNGDMPEILRDIICRLLGGI